MIWFCCALNASPADLPVFCKFSPSPEESHQTPDQGGSGGNRKTANEERQKTVVTKISKTFICSAGQCRHSFKRACSRRDPGQANMSKRTLPVHSAIG